MPEPVEAASQLPMDTSVESARLQLDLWRRMSPSERASLAGAISDAADELCLAGIRMRHPGASEREVFLRRAIIRLGAELAVKAYPEAAALAGPRR